MKRSAAVRLALLVAPLMSAGCNAILGIDEPKLGSPADAASDDVRIDVDSGSRVFSDGSTDATGVDTYASPDRRDTDAHEGGSSGADAVDARDGGDGGAVGGDGGDAGPRILVLRGTISTIKLAPAAAGNVRLADHGIAVPGKSCNASNCVSGGIAP